MSQNQYMYERALYIAPIYVVVCILSSFSVSERTRNAKPTRTTTSTTTTGNIASSMTGPISSIGRGEQKAHEHAPVYIGSNIERRCQYVYLFSTTTDGRGERERISGNIQYMCIGKFVRRAPPPQPAAALTTVHREFD